MAGQLAVTARKSIPVENRSSRLFSAAGVGALVIATSQWAHWAGYADWDLLSLIPGFAQVTGLLPNAYADGTNFDCPNKTLGSEIALMSDEMLKTVGKTLCTKEELIAASLRGGDGQARRRQLSLLSQSAEAVILPLLPIMHAPVQPPRFMQAPAITPVAQSARPFTMASLAPVRTETNKDLLDEINLRARRADSVDPCSGALATRSAAGCGIEQVPVDDTHSGGGSSGPGSGTGGSTGGGSDGGHDVTEIDYEDHSGSGGGSSGSDGGESGDSGDSSHSGSDGHSGDGGHDVEDGHSGGGSGDGGSSHDSSGDYTDNSGAHGGGESHDGGDTSHDSGSDSSGHDSVETVDQSHDSSGSEDSHSGSSTAEETHGGSSGGEYESHSGGGADSSSHGGSDGESSHGGSGSSGSDGGSHSGGGHG
jgi:hypothetical protein